MSGFYTFTISFVLVCVTLTTRAQDAYQEQLTDMVAVKDALLEGYPLRFFVDFSKCDRTPLVSIPGVDIEEPSDFGTVIDAFRGLRDITGIPIQLTFTATEVILFPGIPEHIIVHTSIEALPDGTVNVIAHYIQRANVTELGNSINDCKLNDGSNDEGVFFYKNTMFTPVPITTYADMEASFMAGYAIRYQAVFSRCGEFNTGTDALGGGLMPLYYFKRGEKIIASAVRFYNSPFALNKYAMDTFKVDIYSNLTMHIALTTIGVDDFALRFSEELFNCPLNDPPESPFAVVFRMEPNIVEAPTEPPVDDDTTPVSDDSSALKTNGVIALVLCLFVISSIFQN